MSLLGEILDRVFRPNRDPHAVPVLDGAYSPNRLLERGLPASPVVDGADDFLVLDAASDPATFLISAPGGLLEVSGERTSPFGKTGPAGALALHPQGAVLVATTEGILALDRQGRELWRVTEVGGRKLRCITQISAGADGTIYLTDGSDSNSAADWKADLMQRRAPTGCIVALDASGAGGRFLAQGLSWPSGVAVDADGQTLWFNESWNHRLWRMNLQSGERQLMVRNFTGYPGRIAPHAGGFWMSFFALRTELTEFVLSERKFCEQMMAEIPRDLWIGPALNSRMAHLAPTQMGGIKKLGIEKAWAPPRSYGLVAAFDRHGEATASWHSRVGGRYHGVTSVRIAGGKAFALSKGDGIIIEIPETRSWLMEAGK